MSTLLAPPTRRPARQPRGGVARLRQATASALVIAFVTATLSAQSMPFALEVPGGHRLWQVDDLSLDSGPWSGPGAISGVVQFLPVDLPGYARSERLCADLPRLEQAQGPAPHVRLPVLGSLYRVRESGNTHLLMVRADGTLESLLSVADNGPGAGILPGLAVARSGTAALVATSPDAGGDAIVVDLAPGGKLIDLTQALPPLTISSRSMRLGPDTAWFLGDGALHRATLGVPPPLGETATPVPVVLGPGESLLEDTVVSRDGHALAVISEDPLGNRLIHLAGTTGSAQALTATPGAYDLPDYDSPVGPFVVLSDDGSRIAWRQTLLAKKELFTRPTNIGGALSQVTDDQQFIDTIDNVGVMGFKPNGVLVFAAGEANVVGIGSADFFLVDLTAGTGPMNLTQTSGQATAPFTAKGDIEIVDVAIDPTNTALLVEIDPDDGDSGILRVPTDGVTAPADLITGLLATPQLTPVGETVLIFSEPDLPSVPRRVQLLSATGQLTQLANVPDAAALVIDRLVVDRTGTKAAFVASVGPGIELPGIVDLLGPSVSAAWQTILGVSPVLAFSPTGRLAAGVGFGGLGPYTWVGFTGFSMGVLYNLPVSSGFPLEG